MKFGLSTALLFSVAVLVAPQAMAASSMTAAADVANNNKPKTTPASMNANVNASRSDASVNGNTDADANGSSRSDAKRHGDRPATSSVNGRGASTDPHN